MFPGTCNCFLSRKFPPGKTYFYIAIAESGSLETFSMSTHRLPVQSLWVIIRKLHSSYSRDKLECFRNGELFSLYVNVLITIFKIHSAELELMRRRCAFITSQKLPLRHLTSFSDWNVETGKPKLKSCPHHAKAKIDKYHNVKWKQL